MEKRITDSPTRLQCELAVDETSTCAEAPPERYLNIPDF